MKLSAIDIGTNTFLMVIAEQVHPNVPIRILEDIHAIARLGENVDTTRYISVEAYRRAEKIANEYRRICTAYNVQYIRAVATSAVRDALNGKEICNKLSAVLGTTVYIISGDEEARFSFLGINGTMNKKTVIDIGGGSTEYITGEDKSIYCRMSLQIGAVRLHERYFQSLPPSYQSIENARSEIRQHLRALPQASFVLSNDSAELGEFIGVGGTCTTLAAIDAGLQEFDSQRIEGYSLPALRIHDITNYLLNTPLLHLLKNPAIHPQRADILPAGALILDETMKFFNLSSCRVSTKGLRYGVLYETFERLNRHRLK
ncbi:MAG: Ppx/GppA phosphatase family protein [Bacteroidota bacterium]|nr:Ppx/GppA family phosphatase [Candidatus Kapabacteria bacterium]MDW8219811.1 Ppx/GppA phosphatase family protein [Bacteroidota bacterium]